MAIWVCAILVSLQASAQFSSFTLLKPVAVTTDTKDKPQSKVWTYGGYTWTVLADSAGTYVKRLDGASWTNILRLSTSRFSKADCKVSGNVTHILLDKGTASDLISVEYVPESNTYKLWSVQPKKIPLSLDSGVETVSMDIDTKGRMWVASDGDTIINVRWSDYPYTSWNGPLKIAGSTSTDDISAIIAIPALAKIGVLWSNQRTRRFGFRTHTDGDSPTIWSADEVPASQSALNVGTGMADDHLNITVASDGTLYCAVKTSYEKTDYPKLALLVRRPAGTWDNLYEITKMGVGTRPRVILNELLGKIKVIYTAQ